MSIQLYWKSAPAGVRSRSTSRLGKPKRYTPVDVLSAEHNKFWEYVGSSENISYDVVEDTDLSHIPENSIDYFFSFGCLCHASNEVIEGYIVSLGKKMKSGSRGFLMIADYDKFNYCVLHPELFSVQRALRTRRTALEWIIISVLYRLFPYSKLNQSEDQNPKPGRWFNYGRERACNFLQSKGFEIVEKDMEVNNRDPLIHFCKK